MSVADTSPFGRGLRHWRRIRGVSQLDLAATAATTTRHVSFLETGRSRPSRDMVDRLGDALAIPLRERNRLLEMAGLSPGYVEGDLASSDLAPFQAVIDRLLAAHDPYPGFVLDRHWNIIQTNRGSELFLASFDGRNIIELALGAWRPLIENWTPVAGALRERLAADLLRFPDDEKLQQLHDRLRDALGPPSHRSEPSTSRVICPTSPSVTPRSAPSPLPRDSNLSPTSPSTRCASSSPTPRTTPPNASSATERLAPDGNPAQRDKHHRSGQPSRTALHRPHGPYDRPLTPRPDASVPTSAGPRQFCHPRHISRQLNVAITAVVPRSPDR